MQRQPELTVIMVEYENEKLVELNMRLVLDCNPDFQPKPRFIIVNNSNSPTLELLVAKMQPEVLPGVERVLKGDRGSYHHAAALSAAVARVKTRYVLIMDPDFFIIRRGWLNELFAKMERENLRCVASTWHPKASLQPKYQPTIHFMLLDTQQIPLQSIDLQPSIEEHFAYHQQVHARKYLPQFIKSRLVQSTLKDTAWRLSEQLKQKPEQLRLLKPVFEPHRHFAKSRLVCDSLMPQRLAYTPRRRSTYSTNSFLQQLEPDLYNSLCEEFWLDDSPFAVHLRQVGRHWDNPEAKNAEIERIEATLMRLINELTPSQATKTEPAISR